MIRISCVAKSCISQGVGMRLSDLLEFEPVVIQCHDSPDADAIASGFALVRYFARQGRSARFV